MKALSILGALGVGTALLLSAGPVGPTRPRVEAAATVQSPSLHSPARPASIVGVVPLTSASGQPRRSCLSQLSLRLSTSVGARAVPPTTDQERRWLG